MIRFLVVFSLITTTIFGQSDSKVIASYHRNAIYSAALSFNAHFQLIGDIDQIDAWQRRSVLGVGLAYTLQNN